MALPPVDTAAAFAHVSGTRRLCELIGQRAAALATATAGAVDPPAHARDLVELQGAVAALLIVRGEQEYPSPEQVRQAVAVFGVDLDAVVNRIAHATTRSPSP